MLLAMFPVLLTSILSRKREKRQTNATRLITITREFGLAPAPVLGILPVARHRACGAVCVAAVVQVE